MTNDLKSVLQAKVQTGSNEVSRRYQELLDISKNAESSKLSESGSLRSVESIVKRIEDKLSRQSFKPPIYNEASGRFLPSTAIDKSLSTHQPLELERAQSENRLISLGKSPFISDTHIKNTASEILKQVEQQLCHSSKEKAFSLKDWAKSFLKAFLDLVLKTVSEPVHSFVHYQMDRLEGLKKENIERAAIETGINDAVQEFASQLTAELVEQDSRGNLKYDAKPSSIDTYVLIAATMFQQGLNQLIFDKKD